MEAVTTTDVYQFGNELLVELIGIDEQMEIVTETIEIDRTDAGSDQVTPREEIPEEYKDHVCTVLSDHGYTLIEP